ncbi:MAG TPA: PAS domain S-box protein [Pyrinomonadaceae bacterium]|nr:PAS domain S-box protein [Pyrinomonadaceae bacterium]
MTEESPQLLRHLIDSSVDGILAFDREYRYTHWNRAMESISGLRREEVVGRSAFDVFPFIKETGEDSYFHEALAGRSVVAERRSYLIPQTGRRGLFDGYYSPLRNESGEVIGGVAVIRDITEREEAEEALRASEERYRAFISNSSEGIWRFELEQPVSTSLSADEQIEHFYSHGYLAECNDAMARMYGFERAEEITGARLGDLLVRSDPQNAEYLQSFIAARYRLTDVQSVEVDREGRQRIFLNNLIGVVEEGWLFRAWGTQRDITERKKREIELRATEHRFSMFMENLPGLAWIKDLEGRYVYANQSAAKAFKRTSAELYGKTDDEIFPAETAEQFKKNDSQAVKSGAGIQTIETLLQEDGLHYSIVSKFPILDFEGRPQLVGGIAVDITARRQAEEEARRLATIVEATTDFVAVTRVDGPILYINRAGRAMLGIAEGADLKDYNRTSLSPPWVYERTVEEWLPKALRDGYASGEGALLSLEGEEIPVSFVLLVQRDEKGEPEYLSTIARDITELKRTGDALRESELRFRLMFDQAVVGMVQSTAEGVLLKVNPGFCRILGYDEEELIGRNVFDLTHADDREPDLRHASRAIGGEITGYEMEKRLIRRDGSPVWVNLTATAVRDEAGAQLFGLGIVEDITERKRAEEERERLLYLEQEARATAEAANRMKDEFLATVSHELRTPLTAVVGWSRMLRSGNLDGATAEHALEVILRNAQAQAQIVEDILEVSRIITGKIRLNMQVVDPTPAVSAAIDAVRPAAEAKGIFVEPELDPKAGPVRADPDRLQQIAWNLLSNAVKFTPKGGRVNVRLFDLNGHARLEVRDTGQGIPREFLPHVFERFRQADSSTTRQHGGLGLGLAIVRHLTELHGGSVFVESDGAGKGAIFSVDIPREKMTAEKELLDTRLMPELSVESEKRTVQSLPDLQGARILIVEDELDTRDFLAALLGQCRAEVKTASRVDEALKIFTDWEPQLIVSDLGMPGEDGFSFIRKVRQLEAAKGTRTPAVALSGYTRNEDRALSLASGFERHLPKPVEPFELAEVISRLIKRDGR